MSAVASARKLLHALPDGFCWEERWRIRRSDYGVEVTWHPVRVTDPGRKDALRFVVHEPRTNEASPVEIRHNEALLDRAD